MALVLTNATLTHCTPTDASDLRAHDEVSSNAYRMVTRAALAMDAGRIVWCGSVQQLPAEYRDWPQRDANQRVVTPALIDCHTHLVHGGHRAQEFELRLNGASYAEVAAAGGGIVSTVAATRQASVNELVAMALPRVDSLLREGVGIIEIKSGYGLDSDTELNMLRAARRLGELRQVRVVTSFLGAHAVPKDAASADQYIDDICIPTLHRAHDEGLVDAVDGFCESIAFSPPQIARVFDAATALGLPLKLHAEQLSLLGGAQLAARYNALSADHLEYLDADGVRAMAAAGTVAVLLPGAFYTLRETQLPPLSIFREHNVPIAIATDSNPGSSPLTSLLLAMNMAATLFRMTPAETLDAVTANAARALGLTDCGNIKAGMRADLAIWDIEMPAELCYRIGFNSLHDCLYGGNSRHTTS